MMIKNALRTAAIVFTTLAMTTSVYAYIAHLSVTIAGTPFPVKVHKSFNQYLEITNLDSVPANDISVVYQDPTNTGLTKMKFSVVRMSDNTVICSASPCTVGSLNPNQTIRAIVSYKAQKAGYYENMWYLYHDGWMTPYGTLMTIVK